MNQNKHRFSPLMMAICVVIGILIGTFYANHFSGNRLSIINSSSNKLNNLLHIIDDQYVDTVNVNDLVEKAMPQILAELDPHSVYISAKDVQQANDDLRGSFSGVGIEFTIRQDTLHVQQVISNGPAERAGLIAGDKIVTVDDKPFTGKTLTNEEAMHRLKGPKDTKVKLGIVRYGEKKIRDIVVTRGEIPTKSVTATYMLDDETGYIRIKNFGENTYPELLIALAKLSQEDFQEPLHRPARQYGRLPAVGRTDSQRVPAQEPPHRLYAGPQVAPSGVSQRRARFLPAHTARGPHRRGLCLRLRDSGRCHSGQRPRHHYRATLLRQGTGTAAHRVC